MNIEKLVEYGLPREYVELLIERGVKKLNPVQRTAVAKGVLNGRNLVVATPTASGKTLIGELGLVKTIYSGGMGVYLVPLRALASEKYFDLKVLEKIGLRIGISTGDYDSPAEHLGYNDLLIATYERFDSLLRLKPRWLRRVRCIVVDELHLINDAERGPIVEMIIARLLNRGVQLIGLSATIGNPHVLAEWMKAELVDTPWRPVKLVEGFYDRKRNVVVYSNNSYEKIVFRIGVSALNIALQSIVNGVHVLVFVHNRRRAEEWAEKLIEYLGIYKHMIDRGKLEKILGQLRESPSKLERERLSYLISNGVAYHHAGLSSVARRVVEEAFREQVVKAVFATPTLAAGVNLPARRVLVSIKRYDPSSSKFKNIPVSEYKQMAGRAGRPQYDEVGEAIIYDARSDSEGWNYVRGAPEPVTSKLGSERSLRIHILSLIVSRGLTSFNELLEIFKNTLYYIQFHNLDYLKRNIERKVSELVEWKMIEHLSGNLAPTKLGRITSITYLDPLSVHKYLRLARDRLSELYYLHLLTYTPDYMRSKPYISERIVEGYEEEALMLAEEDVILEPPIEEYEYYNWLQSFVQALMLKDWINEVDEDTIVRKYGVGPGDIYSARDTASWIAASLSKVEKILGNTDRSEFLEKLSTRIEYGVREDALELVKLEGIGRVRARILLSHGIRSLEDLAETPVEKLLKLPGFGPRIVENVMEQVREALGEKRQ